MAINQDNNSFCVLPWVHLYIEPSGDVFTCCLKNSEAKPLGNINIQTVEEIWNSPSIKSYRKDFLNGTMRADNCSFCYSQEKSGGFSHRKHFNSQFMSKVEDDMFDKTDEDGHFSQFKLFYWDFRFSNICNLKCRTCGPIYSSSWTNDAKAMGTYSPDKRVLDKKDKFEFLVNHIECVEEIYFAGGEPLLMEEHYKILDLLLKANRTHVKLSYNSSCNNIIYKGKPITEYWKQFSTVVLSPSLDHYGKKSEIMRSGSKWSDVFNNIKKIQNETPHVFIHPTITVSNMNVMELPKILLEFHTHGIVNLNTPDKITLNILRTPELFSVASLPHSLKIKTIYNLKSFEQYLSETMDTALPELQYIYSALNEDQHAEGENFVKLTQELDNLRNENFFEVFPHLEQYRKNNHEK